MMDGAVLLLIALVFLGLCTAVTAQNIWIKALSRRLDRAEASLKEIGEPARTR